MSLRYLAPKNVLSTLLLFIFITPYLYANQLYTHQFHKNETILGFLKRHALPPKIYYDLSRQDKEVVSDIYAGMRAFILKNDDNETLQALIEVNDLMQLHIYKSGDHFESNIIPIAYEISNKALSTTVKKSVYQSLIHLNSDFNHLAEELKAAFFNTINFRKEIQAGDKIVILYQERLRFGERIIPPRIKSAMIEVRGVPHYIFYYKDRYYDDQGDLLEKFYIHPPLNTRITSNFSLKRFHPILKKYRSHHGVDYRAKKGTKVKAAAQGTVIFKGWKGGYGKTVIIDHLGGYKTLYAHLDQFNPRIHQHSKIKRGQYIAKAGKTGLSTGYHLHLGLYKNNKPINPQNFIAQERFSLKGKALKEFSNIVQVYKNKIATIMNGQ